jgi:proteasome lid subunit RPN8/RPN11
MKILLPREQRARLRSALRRAGSREIGGVLMAEQLQEGSFKIVDFSIDSESGSAAHFVRSPEHHSAALEAFFRRTGSDYAKFNYLGEWHSHPQFPVLPSREDMYSMTSLVNGERGIDFAVLLIVRLRYLFTLECSSTLFAKAQAPVLVDLAPC